MTGRARRQTKQLLREHHARTETRMVDIPAIHEHPACPPLDIDALTEPIVLSPNFAAPAVPTPPPREPLPRRTVPSAQQAAVTEVATRLMAALISRYGRHALNPADVREAVNAAAALVREASR
ncbi:hypothetical protein EHF33_20610 (plasmid) [Deinococcus psychrotolerans]|uniref:Uncharacterized protein n=1 Tax=Deinococcus psychrotolerans TaxID=2489213 RepID=A0A3G8YS09_9DEIO|nr:hypothetical protein [Deinococcus psychrotolerans]AZI45314.1 hypothetical protein EHF33_20610 [Deinococcus psychrotolerans]